MPVASWRCYGTPAEPIAREGPGAAEMDTDPPGRGASATRVAEHVAKGLADRLDPVAVVLGGSLATAASDAASDIDLYVYAETMPDDADRAAVARALGAEAGAEIGNAFFEPGDEWRHAESGVDVDILYRTPGGIEDRLEAVLGRHEASLGHTTCFWHNVLTARVLVDPTGWFARLQARASQEYPEALVRSIVSLNWAMLTRTKHSWLVQLAAALARRDVVSAGHRTTAFLASYFDVLFAINRQPHPGEKRLLTFAADLCPLRPAGLEPDVLALLDAAGRGDPSAEGRAERLLEGLEPFVTAILDET